MRMRLLGTLLVLPLTVAGCGDDGASEQGKTATSPTSTETACVSTEADPRDLEADLDGDGAAETVSFHPADTGTRGCPAILDASVNGHDVSVAVDTDVTVDRGDVRAVRVPGRPGDLVLVLEQHPRGGFQAHLLGYSGGKFEELTVDGSPIFPFVATDVLTDPLSARCVDGGFEITRARPHEPIGIVPAWDVDRTTYALDGNTVTKGATTEIADNVLEKDFHRKYQALIDYALFAGCSTAG